MSSNIRKGDSVLVIAGRDKGKKGEVIKLFPKEDRALVRGVNMVKRHQRPTQRQQGGIVNKEASVHLSNGSVLPSPQQWTNTFTVNVGTEYKLLGITSTRGWDVALRTGYIRSHSPVTDLSFDPSLADSDVHIATGGIGFPDGVLKALLAGADVVEIASVLYRLGIEQIGQLVAGVAYWMETNEFPSVTSLKGLLGQKRCPDPAAYERANYTHAVCTFMAD